ncbi:MAG: hypothetical protein ACOWWH_14090 [Eubacteriaceae bacterium]
MVIELCIWLSVTIVVVMSVCAAFGLIPILIEFDIGKLIHFKMKIKELSSRLWAPKRH